MHLQPQALPNLLEFAQDQHGSRFLQNKLDEASSEESSLPRNDHVQEFVRTGIVASGIVSGRTTGV